MRPTIRSWSTSAPMMLLRSAETTAPSLPPQQRSQHPAQPVQREEQAADRGPGERIESVPGERIESVEDEDDEARAVESEAFLTWEAAGCRAWGYEGGTRRRHPTPQQAIETATLSAAMRAAIAGKRSVASEAHRALLCCSACCERRSMTAGELWLSMHLGVGVRVGVRVRRQGRGEGEAWYMGLGEGEGEGEGDR